MSCRSFLLGLLSFMSVTACFDDSSIKADLDSLKERMEKMESICNELQEDVITLQYLLLAQSQNQFVSNISQTISSDASVQYSFILSDGREISLRPSSQFSVGLCAKIDPNDGKWYWATMSGSWIIDSKGLRIAVHTDSQRPIFRMDGQVLRVSFDAGSTWNEVGKGACESASLFSDISYDEDYVHISLHDGAVISLQRNRKLDLELIVKDQVCFGSDIPFPVAEYKIINGSDDAGITAFFGSSSPVLIEKRSPSEGRISVRGLTFYKTEDGSFFDNRLTVMVTDKGKVVSKIACFQKAFMELGDKLIVASAEAQVIKYAPKSTNVGTVRGIVRDAYKNWVRVKDAPEGEKELELIFEKNEGAGQTTMLEMCDAFGVAGPVIPVVQRPGREEYIMYYKTTDGKPLDYLWHDVIDGFYDSQSNTGELYLKINSVSPTLYWCYNLEELILPTYKHISFSVDKCPMLRKISQLYEGSTTLISHSFDACPKLEELDLYRVLSMDKEWHREIPLRRLTIRSGLKTIQTDSFFKVEALESVCFESLERIEAGAFHHCPALTSITLLKTVVDIDPLAFQDINKDFKIYVPTYTYEKYLETLPAKYLSHLAIAE